MTSINLLHASAPGCLRQGVFRINNHIARHDTLRTLQLGEISSDHKDRDMFVYIIHTKYK